MIFLVLPCNYHSGWGVCSTNLAKELSKKTQIKFTSTELSDSSVNKIEYTFFKSCEFTNLSFLEKQKDHPIIQAVQHDLSDYMGDFTGSFHVCLTFSDRKIPANLVKRAKKFDCIVAGSRWCQKLLEEHGISSQVVHQGIDPILFNKKRSKKEIFLDDFLIFSGGKFECRKGQDITLKAYKVIQDRHPDVKLICAWANPYTDDEGQKALKEANIDLDRVIRLPMMANYCFPQIYQNTDIGVFPSRWEAGTNLVLMEYMACGKPVIATTGTGQGDIVNSENGIIIPSKGLMAVYENEEIVSHCENPDVEAVIEGLEWAYNNRSKAQKLGINAANSMSKMTWKVMADKIFNLIQN